MKDLNKLNPVGFVLEHLLDFPHRQITDTQVFFRNLEERLCQQIEAADAVVGCVAWLSSFPVLEALGRKQAVSIVVQKEDFLRRDSDDHTAHKLKLRAAYESIRPGFIRDDVSFYRTSLPEIGRDAEQGIAAIRCMGVKGRGDRVHPRMHHKFLVMLRKADLHVEKGVFCPYAVWTGSFNPTFTGTRSLENAVLITSDWSKTLEAEEKGWEHIRTWCDTDIPHAYFQEWAQVLAHSEPLDWTSEQVEPEWEWGGG